MWRSSCLCDTNAASKLLSALPMEAPQKMAVIYQAVSEKKMFEHCYFSGVPVAEIKYKEVHEEKLICIFFFPI